MHCYCLKQFSSINLGIVTIRFDDGNKYCSSWLQRYLLANSFIYLIALGIVGVNILVKTILKSKQLYLIYSDNKF